MPPNGVRLRLIAIADVETPGPKLRLTFGGYAAQKNATTPRTLPPPGKHLYPLGVGAGVGHHVQECNVQRLRQSVETGQADVHVTRLKAYDRAPAQAGCIGKRLLAQSRLRPEGFEILRDMGENIGARLLTVHYIAHNAMCIMLHTPPKPKVTLPSFSRHEVALIVITIFWGSTFLIVHQAMKYSGPAFFVGIRFLAAGLMSLLIFHKAMRGLTRKEVWGGTAIGFSLFLGYGLQTHGLQTITSSQSAFITALYVPIVPLLQWMVLGRPPRLMSWVGVGLAFAGLMLLAGPEAGSLAMSPGEIATVLSAVAIAAEIILIGRFANEVDSRRITVVQLLTCGVFSLLAMPVVGEGIPDFSWVWAGAALGLGFASAVIQLTMNWAQKVVSPTRATVIYAGEPVWGGIFGRLAGDRLPALALLGAAFIVAGVIASELQPKKPMKQDDETAQD